MKNQAETPNINGFPAISRTFSLLFVEMRNERSQAGGRVKDFVPRDSDSQSKRPVKKFVFRLDGVWPRPLYGAHANSNLS